MLTIDPEHQARQFLDYWLRDRDYGRAELFDRWCRSKGGFADEDRAAIWLAIEKLMAVGYHPQTEFRELMIGIAKYKRQAEIERDQMDGKCAEDTETEQSAPPSGL